MEKIASVTSKKTNAIEIESAYKSYDGKSSVLTNLNLTVERGKIYGLLGPSGCGKTTLLKCMVGKLRLDSGKILVFGFEPGHRATGVPGSRVGYMPQELALFGEFNIEETLRYFSRIFGMSESRFETRMEFLISFLDLPSKTRKLEEMSGGQQRRASLAVALLHQPQLLILDEPTVGVDPLLRQSIWNHLVKIADDGSEGTTVVITTHYTEEAIQAHRVGMLRNGRLLAEDTPSALLSKYNQPGLEEVFLHLCQQDGGEDSLERLETESDRKLMKTSEVTAATATANGEEADSGVSQHPDLVDVKGNDIRTEVDVSTSFLPEMKREQFSFRIVSACMLKTFNRMSKRWGFLIYQFLLPAIQVSLFCMAIGQDPKNLPVSIVSKELVNGSECTEFNLDCPVDFGLLTPISPNQKLGNLSCRYLSFLNDGTILPVWEHSEEEALESVKKGNSWGVVYMSANFSNALYNRVAHAGLAPGDNQDAGASKIQIKLDVTNQQIAFTLQLKLAEAFQKFTSQLADSCHVSTELASIPLEFQDPVYGSHSLTFTDFMAPGIILTIVHSMALGYSAMIIIIERNEGLLDRTWVAGVSPGEFSLAHFLCSISVNIIQVVLTLAFMIGVFKVPVEGSLVLLFFLTLLQGMCGITIGLIISSVCKTQQDATQIALGIFYPNLLLSGILWPIEAMPTVLRYIAYALPQTCACEALRAVLLRGWDINHPVVSRGFLITLVWILGTYLVFKIKISRSQ